MHLLTYAAAFLAAPLTAVAIPINNAAPAGSQVSRPLFARQMTAPPPCVRMDPPPTQEETEARFADFVEAFVGQSKNITKAFEYIVEDYIVRPYESAL